MSLLKEYIERKELATELDLTEHTLSLWERDKKGPPVTRIGRKVLYRRQAVIEWMLKQERR